MSEGEGERGGMTEEKEWVAYATSQGELSTAGSKYGRLSLAMPTELSLRDLASESITHVITLRLAWTLVKLRVACGGSVKDCVNATALLLVLG